MRITIEFGLAIAAGLVAYSLTNSCHRHVDARRDPHSTRSGVDTGSSLLFEPESSRAPEVISVEKRVSAQPVSGDKITPKQLNEQNTLRNAVIVAASESMARRNTSVESCFGSDPIVDTLKLRFTADVSSTAREGITRAWKFIEVIDGQELPPAFATCADAAFGRDQKFVAAEGTDLPTFEGEISIVYTLARPPMDSTEAAGDASVVTP